MGRRRKRAPFRLKLKKETIFTVASLILIILAILSALSLFMSALVLDQMSSLTLALFGWTRYLFPLVLITAGFSLTRIKWDIAKGNVFLGITLLWMAFISLTRAGELGDAVFEGLSSLVSTVGAVMLLITVGVVGVVVLFNTSLDAVVSSLGALFQSLGNFFKLYILRRFLEKKRKPLIVRTTPKFDFEGKAAVKIQKDEITPMGERKLGGSQLTSELVSNVPVESGPWTYPPLTLLNDTAGGEADRGDIKKNAATIEDTLESFGIQADVTEVNPGPAVTQYALEIALGTKLSKITALQNNLALALATKTGSLRIEAPIPGRPLVGIEVPNITPQIVTLKQMLVSKQMQQTREKLVIPLGLNVAGDSVVFDIAKMPHVLIAGQTGSGKSVAINSFITTLLFRTTPTEVKLILVDPKRVELTGYNGIPHLLTPVIVEVDKVISALKWAINEMERRYKLFQSAGEKNIEEYNSASGFQALPYILIFIDELADIMAYAPSDVEDSICRLAQMARATGIHLVLSTQRPSVDVLTGLIKANIPCRVAFTVSSMVDSRVILDMPGAEKLLGRGDMLFIPPDQAKPQRIQGTFISTEETRKLVKFLQETGVAPEYTEEVTEMQTHISTAQMIGDEEADDFFEQAVETVCQYDRASASLLQRRLKVGYARAARILDQLEKAGIVGPAEGAKPRDVLIRSVEEYRQAKEQQEG